jgi:hypothetical protein
MILIKYILSTAVAVGGLDTYSESLHRTPLSDNSELLEFTFRIGSQATSPKYLDIFPQPIATVLHASGAKSIQANFVRGGWKSNRWGNAIETTRFPSGSSMTVEATTDLDSLWTQAAWMFSAVLGGSFESLDPKSSKQYRWIQPFDFTWNAPVIRRISSNPNEPCCTENTERFIELLPCRGKRGLAALLTANALEIAASEYMGLSVIGERLTEGGNEFTARFFFRSGNPLRNTQSTACIGVVAEILENQIQPPSPVTVARSIVMTANRPERIQGKLVVHITNNGNTNKPIEYHDQFPFFLTPLWHTERVNGGNVRKEIISGDGNEKSTFASWFMEIPPNTTITLTVDLYKRFIPVDKFSFSFEKGFDVGSAILRVGQGDWLMTPGLITVTGQPDATATFNVIALTSTAVALFFSLGFRNWAVKRSTIVGTDPASLAEKQPTMLRVVKWLLSFIPRRIRS